MCRPVDVSKNASVGAVASDSFALLKMRSCSVVHMKSFLVLRSGRRGARSPAMESVLAESWLARPKKEQRSVRLDGVRNLLIL